MADCVEAYEQATESLLRVMPMVMGTRNYECMTEGCLSTATNWVAHPNRRHNRHVCSACRDEMCSVFGYVIQDWSGENYEYDDTNE